MRLQSIAVLASILLFSEAAAAQTARPSTEQLPFVDARNMTLMVFFADPPLRPGMLPIAHRSASGSGVWIGKGGYVATCHHVIANWNGSFKIGYAEGSYVSEGLAVPNTVSVWDADLVVSDPVSDVAILKAHISPGDLRSGQVVTGAPTGKLILPQIPVSPKGATLRTDFPRLGETLLLAGYPIGGKKLILQTGPATGVDLLEDIGLRMLLSLVSNPGNSGGPIFDAEGRVVGLLEGNLLYSVAKDKEGNRYIAYCGWARIGLDGKPVLDPSGNPLPPPDYCMQNTGISYAVPAIFIAELAKKHNINLE